jgi:hypothetical protein
MLAIQSSKNLFTLFIAGGSSNDGPLEDEVVLNSDLGFFVDCYVSPLFRVGAHLVVCGSLPWDNAEEVVIGWRTSRVGLIFELKNDLF